MKLFSTIPLLFLFAESALAVCASSGKSASGPNKVCKDNGVPHPWLCNVAGEVPKTKSNPGEPNLDTSRCELLSESPNNFVWCCDFSK
ncbi:hypothetical protein HYFRA_00001186 [Hymenoscyphus fraxineus]|uniref:Uncharacterized protein n=1 Tax=Hymenoscyphus fraxineus TaxID=746836 RepID=A0A9N9KR86_9HELO|nr:hypothetical protein HYFRA_00001186 [Hymenoscyphus fraxineus]